MNENSHSHPAQRNSTKVHSPYFLNKTKKWFFYYFTFFTFLYILKKWIKNNIQKSACNYLKPYKTREYIIKETKKTVLNNFKKQEKAKKVFFENLLKKIILKNEQNVLTSY